MLKLNVGTIDRTIRILLGLALMAAANFGAIGPWGWLGVVLVVTGAIRFCPAYFLLKMSTSSVKQ